MSSTPTQASAQASATPEGISNATGIDNNGNIGTNQGAPPCIQHQLKDRTTTPGERSNATDPSRRSLWSRWS